MPQSDVLKWNGTLATNQPAAEDYIPVSLSDGTAIWVPFSSMGGGTDLTDAVILAPANAARNTVTPPSGDYGLSVIDPSGAPTGKGIRINAYNTLLSLERDSDAWVVVTASGAMSLHADDAVVPLSVTGRNNDGLYAVTGNTSGTHDYAAIKGEAVDSGNIGVHGTTSGAGSIGVKGTGSTAGWFEKTVANSNPTIVVKRKSSQTSNLQEWHDESGNVLASIDANGKYLAATDARTLRTHAWMPVFASSTILGWNFYSGSSYSFTTGSASNLNDSTGTYISYATGGTINTNAGFTTGGLFTVTQPQALPTFISRVKTGADITDVRIWTGLSNDGAPMSSSTAPVSSAMFRYATDVDGTAFWRTVTRNSSSTVNTTSVAVATDTMYVLKIVFVSTSIVEFYINGTLVATHTTNLPGASDDQYLHAMVRNLAAVTKSIRIGRIYHESA